MLEGYMLDCLAHGLILHWNLPRMHDRIDSRISREQRGADCAFHVALRCGRGHSTFGCRRDYCLHGDRSRSSITSRVR